MRTFFAITLSTVAVPVLRIPLLARGWQLFAQRLARAQKILHDVRDWQPKCPMWWLVYMQVALGQGWSRSDYENIFTEAKAFEPQCWDYDVARAHYLLPRWHGQPGDWEYATDEETSGSAVWAWKSMRESSASSVVITRTFFRKVPRRGRKHARVLRLCGKDIPNHWKFSAPIVNLLA